MASRKRLRSVAHSVAHHAVSGLSYLHPHLGIAAREIGQDEIIVDMLADDPCPTGLQHILELKTSLAALRVRFEEILASEDIEIAGLAYAVLWFDFETGVALLHSRDDYCSNCHALLITKEEPEQEIRVAVNYNGNSIPTDDRLRPEK